MDTPAPRDPAAPALPNFRNLGVMVRILLGVNALALVLAVARAPSGAEIVPELVGMATLLEPALLACVLVCYAGQGLLARLSYGAGVAVVFATALAVTAVAQRLIEGLTGAEQPADPLRPLAFAALAAALMLWYFGLRSRALSPALTEARLAALQARIRPHFLFNSINAVLSLIRAEPRRAESALEDLAELMRAAMGEQRRLSTLEREVMLCRQYLELEALRLGDRLVVDWHADNLPKEALIPPLTLQPLLENAVYHGIEPVPEPGCIQINIWKSHGRVHAVLRNPYRPGGDHHSGNRIALANIRERLALHFDAEASLETKVTGDMFEVHIALPYIAEDAA